MIRSISSAYSFGSHLNPFHGAVLVIKKPVDTNRAVETTTTNIRSTIMVNKIAVTFKFNNSLMISIGVSGKFVKYAFVFPGTGNCCMGNRYIPVKLIFSFNYLQSPGIALGPGKICNMLRYKALCPDFHVFGGPAQP
jgi:hypothetical protein